MVSARLGKDDAGAGPRRRACLGAVKSLALKVALPILSALRGGHEPEKLQNVDPSDLACPV